VIRVLGTAVVLAWFAGTAVLAHAAAVETHPAPLPAGYVLAHARISCAVDRFDTAEQTRVFRASDLSATALRCVLDAVGAPSYVATDIARTRTPMQTSTASWGTATATWYRDPESGVDVTIRMTGTAP